MVDLHCHLHVDSLKSDIEGVINRFSEAGGKYILSCAVDMESAISEIEISSEYENVYTALGFHPEITIPGSDIFIKSVSEKWVDENLKRLEKLVNKSKKVIAIGEIGLDYYWVKKMNVPDFERIYKLQQYMAEVQIKLASKLKLPVIIHCRDIEGDKHCESDILKLITQNCNSCVKGVFHSYTGSPEYLRDILDLGFYVSFNAIVTFDDADNVRKLLEIVPDDRLLLETDSPLLVPAKYRRIGYNHGEPRMIDEIANFVARVKKMSTEKLWDVVESNSSRLFGL